MDPATSEPYAPEVTDSLVPQSRRRTAEEVADYVVELATALERYGCPSYRVEQAARVVAALEGFHAEPFVLPTSSTRTCCDSALTRR